MRLVWFHLRRFRRFESARVNVDAPVVALVGPNESGKTSLLNALTQLGGSAGFDPRDVTRGLALEGRVVEATFLLDDDDRKAIEESVPMASEVRWYRVWRNVDGSQSHEVIPPLLNSDDMTRAIQALTEVRGASWRHFNDLGTAARIGEALSILERQPTDYTEEELATLTEFSHQLVLTLVEEGIPPPVEAGRTVNAIDRVVEHERQRRLQELALSKLQGLAPRILEFSESARTLRSEYNLEDPSSWTDGVKNLARLGGFSLPHVSNLVKGSQPELWEDLLDKANRRLTETLSAHWSQVNNLRVRLNVSPPPWLKIYVAAGEGELYRMEDRSAGLRTFVALMAFLAEIGTNIRPVLVVDEAENHLHWDAQADLVNLFYNQDVASQIIYSTHSPGCLPHDLGAGVRAVVPDPGQDDRSHVKNWIWHSRSGFRPLLLDMGASTAAVTPHRFAVATEGVADFILLPSLLRQATESDSLPYQIVPGLARLSRDGIKTINLESDRMMYLTDGDDAGKKISRQIRRSGVPPNHIFSLPPGTVLEDLVAGETLTMAVSEEIRRSGHEATEEIELPECGRSTYLDEWYEHTGIPAPSKRAIASRVLEIAARQPNKQGLPLLEPRHTNTLKKLHNALLSALQASTQGGTV